MAKSPQKPVAPAAAVSPNPPPSNPAPQAAPANPAANTAPKVAAPVRRAEAGASLNPAIPASTLAASTHPEAANRFTALPFWVGISLTAVWFLVVLGFVGVKGAAGTVAGIPLTTLAFGISAVVAPVALLWMVIAYVQRATDVQALTDPLQEQLKLLMTNSNQAESRIHRFNDVLERQLRLMRQAGDGTQETLQNTMQALREEERAINNLADRSGREIQRVAGMVRDNTLVLENLLHDNQDRLSSLAARIAGQIETLDGNADKAVERLGGMIAQLQDTFDQFNAVADNKLLACSETVATIREREKLTEDVARRMHDTLHATRIGTQELSGLLEKNQESLDGAATRLLGRMTEISSKNQAFVAETQAHEQKLLETSTQLSGTLAGEIATLDTLTQRLESQLVATNKGLGTRTKELDAQQDRLAEQAGSLTQSLQKTIQALDSSAQQAFSKFVGLREGVATQSGEMAKAFHLSSAQYEEMTLRLNAISRTVVDRIASIGSDLAEQIAALSSNGLRAVAASEKVQTTLGNAAEQLARMVDRVVAAEAHGEKAAASTARAYASTFAEIEKNFLTIEAGIDKQLGSMTSRYDASFAGFGESLATLEASSQAQSQRLTADYDNAFAHVRESLAAIGQNAETHVARMAQAHQGFAQTSRMVAEQAAQTEAAWGALLASAETKQQQLEQQLRQQLAAIAALLDGNAVTIDQAREALYKVLESALSRNQELTATLAQFGVTSQTTFDTMLARVQEQVGAAESKLEGFTATFNRNAAEVAALSKVMGEQSVQVAGRAGETLGGLQAVASQIAAMERSTLNEAQEISLRFSALVAALQARMGELSSVAESEQRKMGDQITGLGTHLQRLKEESGAADARLQQTHSSLREQASQTKASLEQETASIATALQALQQRFTAMAQELHSTSAQSKDHIEQALNRYSDLHVLGKDNLFGKAEALSDVVGKAAALLGALGETLTGKTNQLQGIHQELARSVTLVGDTTQSGVDRLAVFSQALINAQHVSQETAQQVFARLSEIQEQFSRQITAVEGGSSQISTAMGNAVAHFAEQAAGLGAASQQAEQRVVNLATATTRLQQQAAQVSSAIDGEAEKMQQRLGTVLRQIEGASAGMERNAMIAFDRSEGMAKRFETLADAAFATLSQGAERLENLAEGTTQKVNAVNQSLTQQVVALSFAGEHLTQVDSDIRLSADKTATYMNQLASEASGNAMVAAKDLRLQLLGLQQEAESILGRFDALGRGLAHQSLNVMQVAANLEQELWKLRDTAVAAHDDAAQARQHVVSQTVAFKDEMAAATHNIKLAGETLQQRTDHAVGLVQDMVQRFVTVTASLRDQFEQQTGRLQQVTSQTCEQLQLFSGRLEKNVGILADAKENLGDSGQHITGMLEKANFLLRNMTGQIDRVKVGTEELSGTLLQRLSGILSHFEDDLRAVSTGTHLNIDTLHDKLRGIRNGMQQEAVAAAAQMLSTIDAMRRDITASLDQASSQAAESMAFLQAEGAGLSKNLRESTQQNLAEITARFVGIRKEMESEIALTVAVVKNVMENFKTHLEPLSVGLREESQVIVAEAAKALQQLQSGMEASLGHSATQMRQTTEDLKKEMIPLAANLHSEAATAVRWSNEQLGQLQADFRSNLLEMTEALVVHLRQVQENGVAVVNTIRQSSVAASEGAMAGIGQLRQAIQTEMDGLATKVEAVLSRLQQGAEGLNEALLSASGEARDVAVRHFVSIQQGLEGEMRAMLENSTAALRHLQSDCEKLHQTMHQALIETEDTGQRFGRAAETMRVETQKIGGTVLELGQYLAGTQENFVHNQSQLSEVVRHSDAMMQRFSENMARQHQAMENVQGQILSTDQRLALLQQNMKQLVGSMTQQLQGTLKALSQEMSQVKEGSIEAIDAVQGRATQLAHNNQTLVQTTHKLVEALTQMEQVSQSLHEGVENTAAQVQLYENHAEKIRGVGKATEAWMDNLNHKLQSQVATLEYAAETATQKAAAVVSVLHEPTQQIEDLNERLDKTLGLSIVTGEKITNQMESLQHHLNKSVQALQAGLEKNAAANPGLASSTLATVPSPPPAITVQGYVPMANAATPADEAAALIARAHKNPGIHAGLSEAERDTLRRLGDMAQAAGVPPITAPSPPAAGSEEGALVHSLSEIIKKLEKVGSASKETNKQKPKKIGV